MKKFLNYILVAGVAVLGFVGTVYAEDEVVEAQTPVVTLTDEDNTVITAVTKKLTAVNNTIEVSTIATNVDDAELKAEALNAVVKGYTGNSRYYLEFNGTDTLTLKRDMTSGTDKDADPKTVKTFTATVKYADALSPTPQGSVNTKVGKIKATYELNDVEYVAFIVNGSKNYSKYSAEYKDAIKAEGNITITETPVKDENDKVLENKIKLVVKYNGVIVDTKEVTFKVADTVTFYVSEDTKEVADIKAELESRIKAAAAGKTVTVTYPADAETEDLTEVKVYIAGTVIDGVYGVEAVANLKPVTPVVNEITSNSTEVTATADKAVATGTKLVVKTVEDATELAKAVAKDVKDIVAYDIKLVDSDDKEVKFDGVTYTVTVTIPENLKGKDLAAYTIVDGKLEEHKITVDGDKGTFTTTHFSEWIITEVVKVGEDGKVLPNTLDNAASFAFVGVIGLVGMAASALFLNKRN